MTTTQMRLCVIPAGPAAGAVSPSVRPDAGWHADASARARGHRGEMTTAAVPAARKAAARSVLPRGIPPV